MQNRNKFSLKILLTFAFIAFLVFIAYGTHHKVKRASFLSYASFSHNDSQTVHSKKIHFSVAEMQNFLNDTIPEKIVHTADTLPVKISDSLLNRKDSMSLKDSLHLKDSLQRKRGDTLHFKLAKNALEAPIAYTAEDSMVIDVPGKTVTLYGTKVTTDYKDNNITGPIISFDEASGEIRSYIKRDSTGKVIAFPTMKQSDFTSQFDSVRFNMKTGKGITRSTYTQQGEMYVYGQVIKKVSPEVFYALRGRFTTCDLDTPHFAFISNKIKFINNKVAISGPVHPEFEGVPIPIYFPFGIYPLNQGRHSGLLPPNFTVNEQRGLGLEGLGYYKVINDYWDIIFRGSIYSYGGWSANVNPRYFKKYHYSGSFSFDVQHFNLNFKGDPDFVKSRAYHITWSHSADTKSRPGVTFSANVNAGSSSYNALVPDNPMLNFQNQLTSSIAYSKTWQDKPFNLTLTANHDQNTQLKLINVSLPTVGFNVTTIYPFRKKDAVGDLKWYENIGIGYSMTGQNRFSFYDTVKNKSIFRQIQDTLQWGVHHSLPISISLPQVGYFQLSPSVSYDETWFQNKVTHKWDQTKDTIITNVEKGFYTARQMSFGLNVSTRIFGMFSAKKKNAKIIAVRNEIRPTLGISYQPNFNKNNYYYAPLDSTGVKIAQPYFDSRYNLYNGYSNGRFGGFNFSLESNLSMKVRNKKDTGDNAIKKVSIIDNFRIGGSYNLFPSDFHNFSPISASASTNLFNKLNITTYANFNVYEVNAMGRDTNILVWKTRPFSLGRLTNASLSLSSSFTGGNKKTGEEKGLKPGEPPPSDLNYTPDEYNSEMAYIRNNPGEFADFNIPWSVNLNYTFSITKNFVLAKKGFTSNVTQNLSFNGTLNITPKWQMAVTGYYNLSLAQLNPLSLSLSRDLHCWQMSISITPLGMYRYFSINISPKSPLLRDLKINRTRSFSNPNL